MQTKKKILILSMLFLFLSCFFVGCGSHPVTEKEMLKIEEKYEKGKITADEYYEAVDAYYNGEPLPKRGFFASIVNFFKNVILFIIGVGVIGVVIVALKNGSKK